MRAQPAFRIPDQLFAGEPTRALHESAFDLPARDSYVHRVAGVVQNVDTTDVMHTGKPIDLHLADRRADREIVERLSASRVAVVVDVGRAIKSRRAQARAREIGALQQLSDPQLHFRG